MAYENIQEKFEAMGAEAVVSVGAMSISPGRSNDPRINYTIDVNEKRKQGEIFEVLVATEAAGNVEITVPSIDKKIRHLLLAIRSGSDYAQFLCGHDERHWFVATLPRNVGSVRQAIEVLKPEEAASSQKVRGVRRKKRNKRRNAGFIRQGEWFFIPAPELDERKSVVVHTNEPLRRGQGKPHMAQHLCRVGGETVYVSRRHQNGLTESQYRHAVQEAEEDPAEFRLATRDATVYVKGRISHPDHKTVVLNSWHRVVANTETSAPWRPEMRFID